jgi:hypothetical protein
VGGGSPADGSGRLGRAEAGVLVTVVALAVALVLGATAARRPPDVKVATVSMAGDAPLLNDPGVAEELRAQGLRVTQNYMGSRAVAEDPRLSAYNIASVSSDDAAKQVIAQLAANGQTEAVKRSPMGTPMVVLTYRPIAQLLQRLGVASQGPDGIWTFDMRAYMKVVAAKQRWSDIPGNTTYPNTNQIVLATTDPSASGSGELFLMVLSYLLNDDTAVADDATAARILPQLEPFFVDQGDMPVHTPDLLNEFLTGGMDRDPMIFDYEGDYLAMAMGQPGQPEQPGRLPADLVAMYPTPTAYSETSFVSWDTLGNELSNLLSDDPVLVGLEMKNGQRIPGRTAQFVALVAAHGIKVPDHLDYVISPTDQVLETMIEGISRDRQQGSG